MMVARLEAGDSKTSAATFAYTSTAFPMLTGTLVTVAGFLPIGFNASAAGEYTYSLFVVIAIALSISWIVAVLFAPLVGVAILPETLRQHAERPRRLMTLFRTMLVAAMQLALDHNRHDDGCARSCDFRCALRAAAVLPVVRSARDPGRHDVAADQFDRRDRPADEPVRGAAERRSRCCAMEFVCRARRDSLLSSARSAARQCVLRADRRRGEIARSTQPHHPETQAIRPRPFRRHRHLRSHIGHLVHRSGVRSNIGSAGRTCSRCVSGP